MYSTFNIVAVIVVGTIFYFIFRSIAKQELKEAQARHELVEYLRQKQQKEGD